MKSWKLCRGLTLLELLISVTLIGIITAFAYPSFISSTANRQISSMTRELHDFLHLAKTEAVRRNAEVEVFYDSNNGNSHCFGMRRKGEGIDCSASTHTFTLLTIAPSPHYSVKTWANSAVTDLSDGILLDFDPTTGRASTNIRVLFQRTSDSSVLSGVRVTNIGRVRYCSEQEWHGWDKCVSK